MLVRRLHRAVLRSTLAAVALHLLLVSAVAAASNGGDFPWLR